MHPLLEQSTGAIACLSHRVNCPAFNTASVISAHHHTAYDYTMINSKPAGNCSIIPFIALDILRKTIKYSRRSPCDPTLVSNNSYYCHSSRYQLRPCTILNLKPLLNCNRRVHVIVSDRSFYKRPPPFFFCLPAGLYLNFQVLLSCQKGGSVAKRSEWWTCHPGQATP